MAVTLVASYCDVDTLNRMIPTLQDITAISSQDIYVAIALGEGEINGKLAKKYDLPFTLDIQTLTTISFNLGAYYILRPHVQKEKQNVDDWVDTYRRDARDMIKQIVDGDLELLDENNDVVPQSAGDVAQSSTMDFEETTGEADITEQIVDPDKLNDWRQDRGIGT